jgi:hypothetical protein
MASIVGCVWRYQASAAIASSMTSVTTNRGFQRAIATAPGRFGTGCAVYCNDATSCRKHKPQRCAKPVRATVSDSSRSIGNTQSVARLHLMPQLVARCAITVDSVEGLRECDSGTMPS